jgi:signal transduction histidine kinase
VLFGRLRILSKLGLLVLVPLLGVLALSVPIVANRVDVARAAQRTADAVALAVQVGSTVQELQDERLASVGYLFHVVQAPDLVVISANAQEHLEHLGHLDQPLSAEMKRAVANVSRLTATRIAVLARTARPDQIITDFTSVITPLITALRLPKVADLTTEAGRQVFALDQALRTDDQINQASAYLTSAVVTQNTAFVGLFSSVQVQVQSTIQQAEQFFTPAQYKLYLAEHEAFGLRVGADFLTRAPTDPAGAVKLLKIETLFPSLESVGVLGGFVEKRIAADAADAVTANRDSALRTAYLIGGGSLLLLFLVIALSAVMARAVARPLRRLTRSADRVARAAERELERVADDEAEAARPIRLDPIDVEARDEIGDLARAFDRVQSTAARLVERQVVGRRNVAQMFGHVGRRTQNLVGRQLALIDTLERRETDTDRLRELYRLDHMSSRLHRNASSLVVLSGGAGTNEHMAPLPLEDVVRLALGEIEDYTRVDVDVPEEIVVVPAVAADLTLLLAELMENATSYSPPHTRVVVTATELRGGARLAVVDQGLGLAPERLAEENARLTRRERLDLAPTEVLGLFVVGRLARRHGIEVTLTDTPENGVTAWIDLRPQHLIPRIDKIGPIQATIGHPAEFALILGGSARSVPGSAQPFDANVLNRATRTLKAARSWDAFAVYAGPAAIEATPSSYQDDRSADANGPLYEAEPVPDTSPYGLSMINDSPVAGRHPTPMPELPAAHPATVWSAETPPLDMEGPIVMPGPAPRQLPDRSRLLDEPSHDTPAAWTETPPAYAEPPPSRAEAPQPYAEPPQPYAEPAQAYAEPPQAYAEPPQAYAEPPQAYVEPAQAYAEPPQAYAEPPPWPALGNGSGSSLRQRVPGSQLPGETGPKPPVTPPTSDDAVSAKEACEAFEAGVHRAQWDAIEADMSSPPAAGHPPLARRVPGASLPDIEPMRATPPVSPARPMDPEAVRALIEQFEYGVALALSETQPQHEGQPR